MEKLIIFPFNGNAIEALDCIGDQYEVIGFVDDVNEKHGVSSSGIPITSRSLIDKYGEAKILAVPGSPVSYKNRVDHITGLNVNPARFAKVIHPRATVSSSARLGYNVLVMPGVVLTSNCEIGNHVCILPGTIVHHDSRIGDYTMLGSGVIVAGHVKVGDNAYIGSGSRLKNNIEIGAYSLVGMGSNVLKSTREHALVYGNPARDHSVS